MENNKILSLINSNFKEINFIMNQNHYIYLFKNIVTPYDSQNLRS